MNIPNFIYGTAWKEDHTEALVCKAVKAGFRAIDTANQKKHYREDFVGGALQKLYGEEFPRESLFLQSKYTYQGGQDHRLPYNPADPFSKQVRDSFESSLRQLHTDYLDSFLLHGPSTRGKLAASDWEVWQTMEALLKEGKTKNIGVSNINFFQLQEILQVSKVKPKFVQNRCYAVQGWDQEVRELCIRENIIYQGFSLLTANVSLLRQPEIHRLASEKKATIPQLIFLFCKKIGILPLTGTSDGTHMKEDLEFERFEITPEEIELIFSLSI